MSDAKQERDVISILTCTHNRPELLMRAAASVRSQTRGDWEHLITDDGSTDPAQERTLVALAGDRRVRVRVRPHVNQPARYWNEMIDLAVGDYICFLDDDNEMLSSYVETMAGALDAHHDVDVVTCGMVLDDGRRFLKNLNTTTEIWQQNTIDNGCFMIRREALERIGYYPLCIRTLEDWALMRRAASCLKLEHVSECLTLYHQNGNTRSKKAEEYGLHRDAEWIKNEKWLSTVGITTSDRTIQDVLRNISWVVDGHDMSIESGYRHLSILYRGDRWIVVQNESDFALNRSTFGDRMVACQFDGHWRDSDFLRTKLVQVINSVRSQRYEAVLS